MLDEKIGIGVYKFVLKKSDPSISSLSSLLTSGPGRQAFSVYLGPEELRDRISSTKQLRAFFVVVIIANGNAGAIVWCR
jgi:hypothetical protein